MLTLVLSSVTTYTHTHARSHLTYTHACLIPISDGAYCCIHQCNQSTHKHTHTHTFMFALGIPYTYFIKWKQWWQSRDKVKHMFHTVWFTDIVNGMFNVLLYYTHSGPLLFACCIFIFIHVDLFFVAPKMNTISKEIKTWKRHRERERTNGCGYV